MSPALLNPAGELTSEARQSLEIHLVMRSLSEGRGDEKQLKAWQELEWRRCLADPAYFIERYGKLVDKSGVIIDFNLWPVQRELLSLWATRESTIAVKSRQLGITTLSVHFALWDCIFHDAAQWFLVSASETAARDAMRRLRATTANLPKWMVERAQSRAAYEQIESVKRRQAESQTVFRAGMSSLEILTSTPKSVAGRAGNFILDEFSRHDDQEQIYQLVLPAFDGGGMAIIIANGNGEDAFYSLYWASKEGRNRFHAHFFDWTCDPNRDDAWYQRMRRDYLVSNPEADEYGFKAQYPANEQEAFYLSGRSRFPAVWVNAHAQRIRDAKVVGDKGFIEQRGKGLRFQHFVNGTLTVFEQPEKGCNYAVGCDPAGGRQSGDYTVIEVVKILGVDSAVQVAEYRAKVEPVEAALYLERIAKFYNNAFCVIERNNHGHAVIAQVKDRYPNLYRHIEESRTFADDYADTLGYPENKRTKTELIDGLASWIDTGSVDEPIDPKLDIRSSIAVNELSRYEIKDNGGTGAPKGQNDDTVVALGLAIVGVNHANVRTTKARAKILAPWQFVLI